MSLEYLPGTARLWTFVSDQKMPATIQAGLEAELTEFVSDWKAHGDALAAGFEIRSGVVVAIAVDERVTPPSGCSIDKVFRLLQDFGNRNGIDFFNRLQVVVMENNEVELLSKDEAKKRYQTGQITDNTPVMDPMTDKLEAYNSSITIPFSRHWLGKQLYREKSTQ